MQTCHRICRLCMALLCLMVLAGCSTTTLDKARLQYAAGDAQAALQTLGDGSEIAARDKLLYWLERGLILHDEGDYELSAEALLRAAEYLEDNDYVSISGEAKALLANDWARRYKGEYSEQLWVHTYLMMNFLSLGRYDSAAVEARRAVARIEDREDLLQHDAFTRALIGLSFEVAGQLNSAYIEYGKLDELLDDAPAPLLSTLALLAQRLGFSDAARNYQLRMADNRVRAPAEAESEVVVFLSTGQLPLKVSSSLFTSYERRVAFPQYLPDQQASPTVTVRVDGEPCDCAIVQSNLGQLARDSLHTRGLALTARLLARSAAKEAFADNLAKNDELAGEIARVLLFVLEEADTRGWNSLPGHLVLIRVPVDSGAEQVVVESNTAPPLVIDTSGLAAGERRFVTVREQGAVAPY